MAQYNFGAGILTLIPPGATPTPVQVGVLKDVSLDVSFTIKELRGAYQFPVDISRGGGKIAGKAKNAQIYGGLLNNLLTGSTIATGSIVGVANEAGTIPAVSTYTVTVANSVNFLTDLGVVDVTTGKQMTRVASAPTTGQYTVAAGVYTFAAADASKAVMLSYEYTATAIGQTIAYSNQLMGAGTTYQFTLYNITKGKPFGVKLWAVQSSKLMMALKNEDYLDQDLEFSGFADSAGRVLSIYTGE